MIAPRVRDYRPFLAVLASLVALCWLALIVWDRSPYGRYLDHRLLSERDGALDLEYAGLAAFFVAGWTLMTVAMMLPTVIPLLLLFRRLTARRAGASALVGLLIAGYLAVWVVVGAVAHLGDLGLHALVERSHWLEDRSWILSASVLFLAGAYQFTPLKRMCLDKCRSPYSFIVEHWQGNRPSVEALRLGIHHGLFCVGCCWSLMLLMFAVAGAGNLVWMLALGAVMATEKNLPWGRKISTPVGVLLLAVSFGLMMAQLSVGVACAHDGGGAC
jgi:predicted metal-binding membrane protein